jgi:hypothetical protein
VFDFLVVHARRWRRLGRRDLLHSVGRDHLPHRLLVYAGSPRRGLAALYGLQLTATTLTWVAAASSVPWPGTVAVACWVAALLWLATACLWLLCPQSRGHRCRLRRGLK